MRGNLIIDKQLNFECNKLGVVLGVEICIFCCLLVTKESTGDVAVLSFLGLLKFPTTELRSEIKQKSQDLQCKFGKHTMAF